MESDNIKFGGGIPDHIYWPDTRWIKTSSTHTTPAFISAESNTIIYTFHICVGCIQDMCNNKDIGLLHFFSKLLQIVCLKEEDQQECSTMWKDSLCAHLCDNEHVYKMVKLK